MSSKSAARLRKRLGGARRRARRLAGRWARRVPFSVTHRSSLIGMVERFEGSEIVGWVAGDAAELPARVTLHLNELEVAGVWAELPSKHNATGAIRGFRFALADVWKYCGRSDRLSVRLGGRPLPIAGKGVYKRPGVDGSRPPAELQRMLAGKYLFNHAGRLQVAKEHDTDWQQAVLGLYRRVGEVVRREYGYDLFAVYGTLLGIVRDGGFISHDNDCDVAYISKFSDPAEVADELRDMAFTLIDADFDVLCRTTAIHVHDERDPSIRIDLFHLFFDQDGHLVFPFGTSTREPIAKSEWRGLTERSLAGEPVKLPVIAEKVAATLYGPSWRTPNPGFQWARARTGWPPGALPESYCEEVHWSNFWTHHELAEPSPFYESVTAQTDLPATVLDLGSGDGRDALGFARAGRRVHGVDRSRVGVEHATRRAANAGLAEVATFTVGDLTEPGTVQDAVKQTREAADGGSVLFYLRFVLNSLTEDEQHALLTALAEVAQPGDALAAEFRTEQDKPTKKTYGHHYRRFQDVATLATALTERLGFTVSHQEEGTGLSPYEQEDPVLGRIVAVRAAGPSSG